MNFPITILMQQDHPTIRVQEDPEVIFVQYRCKRGSDGADGADGETPDITDPGIIQLIIDNLAGEITETELHQDLLTRIDKIDLGPNSLEAQAALLQYGLDQINQSFGVVSGRLADAEGAITVQDSELTALGVDLATLDGTAQGHASLIESLDTRVTVTESGIESQSTLITGLGSRVSVAEASLTGQAAIVNALSTDVTYIDGQMTAMATSVNTVQSSVNANSAAIQQEAVTRAGQTGDLYAKYSVKVDVNGKISGFGLQSTSTSSLFEVRADRFAICNTSGVGTAFPFIVDRGIVYISSAMIANASITSAKIGTAAISTLQVAANAITASDFANFYFAYNITTEQVLLSVSVYAPAEAIGQRVACLWGYQAKGTAGSVTLYDTAGSVFIAHPIVIDSFISYTQSLSHIVTAAGYQTFTLSAANCSLQFGWAYATLNKR